MALPPITTNLDYPQNTSDDTILGNTPLNISLNEVYVFDVRGPGFLEADITWSLRAAVTNDLIGSEHYTITGQNTIQCSIELKDSIESVLSGANGVRLIATETATPANTSLIFLSIIPDSTKLVTVNYPRFDFNYSWQHREGEINAPYITLKQCGKPVYYVNPKGKRQLLYPYGKYIPADIYYKIFPELLEDEEES